MNFLKGVQLTERQDILLGGLYGAVLGDIVGVPYEFYQSNDIPQYDQIGITKESFPPNLEKTYPNVPFGTWSDDTSMMLSLLDSVLSDDRTSTYCPVSQTATQWQEKFIDNIVNWKYNGLYAVDNDRFDIGFQTSTAIDQLRGQTTCTNRPIDKSESNGSLMRNIAVTLAQCNYYIVIAHTIATNNNSISVDINYLSSKLTNNILMFKTWSFDKQYKRVLSLLDPNVTKLINDTECNGTGWVVDCFKTAVTANLIAEQNNTDFKSVIQHAVKFGNDTDTTATVAGSYAGMRCGFSNLPPDWLSEIRDKQLIDQFAYRIIERDNKWN